MAGTGKGTGGSRPAKVSTECMEQHAAKRAVAQASRNATTEKRELQEEILRSPEQREDRDAVKNYVMGTELQDLIQELDSKTIASVHELKEHQRGRPFWTYNPELEEKFVWMICSKGAMAKNCQRYSLGNGVAFQIWKPAHISDFGPGTIANAPKHCFNSEGLVNPDGEPSQYLLVGGKKRLQQMQEMASRAWREHMRQIKEVRKPDQAVVSDDAQDRGKFNLGDGEDAREVEIRARGRHEAVRSTSQDDFNPSGQADQFSTEPTNMALVE